MDNGPNRERRFLKKIRVMLKAIMPICRKLPLRGLLQRLPLPERLHRLEREVLPEEVLQYAKVPAAVEVEADPLRAAPAVAEEVLFREVPVAVAEAVFLRELTAELRVEYLLPLPAHREKRSTVLSHPAKLHRKKRETGKTAQVRK